MIFSKKADSICLKAAGLSSSGLKNLERSNFIFLFLIFFSAIIIPSVSADFISVSQLGYHPDSEKQVIVYTDDPSGNFYLMDSSTNEIVEAFSLQKAKDLNENEVNCQGNIPCIVGDFSSFKEEGSYYASYPGLTSHEFVINNNVYSENIPIFFEFFNAMMQQNSAYHDDIHSDYNPKFTMMADGSFIMEAYQASTTAIRLGSAYRRNPSLFDFDNYNILGQGKPDMQEYIVSYVRYLQGLQGLTIQESNSAGAFRLGTGIKIENAFIPGPTNISSINVYIPGDTPQILENVPVISLCGEDDGSLQWDSCIEDAALYYKCQINEPCLDILYIDRKGIAASSGDGYAVSKGWGYEFGCYFDVHLNEDMFDTAPNPCMVFHEQSSRKDTAMALLAFLESYPAVIDYSQSEGDDLLERSIETYSYIKNNYPAFNSQNDSDFFGASLFLLYDYTDNPDYLLEAHELRQFISTVFPADATRGNEFYWEEYVRHKDEIIAQGMQYQLNGQNPEEFFRGQMYHDYKDEGAKSIGNNAERVFEKYRDTNFHNSRQMLTMGLLALKTKELHQSAEPFIKTIADNQIAWLAGMNGVQDGVSFGSELKSMSFIFGIGNYPEEFHSRYLIDTDYRQESNNEVIGARGTGYQFLNNITQNVNPSNANPDDYVYFDGKFNILDYTLGSLGNGWNGEAGLTSITPGKPFKNGKNYIPGWINGAFDTESETDIIFNYLDSANTYEYTETTNEMVATAIEMFAYMDGTYNNRPRYDGGILNQTPINQTPENQTSINQTPENQNNSGLIILTVPAFSSIAINKTIVGTTDFNGNLFIGNMLHGEYLITASNTGYLNSSLIVSLGTFQNLSVNITLLLLEVNSTNSTNSTNQTANPAGNIFAKTSPGFVEVYLNSTLAGTSNNQGILNIMQRNLGTYELIASKNGYVSYSGQIVLDSEQNLSVNITLLQIANNSNSTNESIIGPVILSSGSNLSNQQGSSAKYMKETDTARFHISSNDTNPIDWYLNGALIQSTTSKDSEFVWTPGILYSPKAPDYLTISKAAIVAQSLTETIIWNVDVENVVNPFFSAIDGSGDILGSDNTKIRVFTNNNIVTFTSLNVTITSSEGSNNVDTVYELDNFVAPNETDWQKSLFNVPYGNIYISSIIGFNNNTGESKSFDLNSERAHYRTSPGQQGSNQESSRRNRESSGGGSASFLFNPSLVYAIFGKDVIKTGEENSISLDARNFNGGIESISATIMPISGTSYTVPLSLIAGSNDYGTWFASFRPKERGINVLSSVIMEKSGGFRKEISVGNVSFYAVSSLVSSEEKLMMVYSTLSNSTLQSAGKVTFKIDARDSLGIKSALVRVRSTQNQELEIPLSLVFGTAKYGTWEASLNAQSPDTTYSFYSLTLANSNESKTYEIKNRSVYVKSLPKLLSISGASIADNLFFSKEGILGVLKKPKAATLVGLGLMMFLLSIMILEQSSSKIPAGSKAKKSGKNFADFKNLEHEEESADGQKSDYS